MLELRSVFFLEGGGDVGGEILHQLRFSARIVDIEEVGRMWLERVMVAPRFSTSESPHDHDLKFFNPSHDFGKDEFTIITSYPFDKLVCMKVGLKDISTEDTPEEYLKGRSVSVGDLMYVIAQGYRKVYEEYADEAGIWGHGIGDLFLEGAEIRDSGIITLSMGS